MLNGKSVGVVVPCYNEGSQIEMVLREIPEFVDKIIVVDDLSIDKTKSVVLSLSDELNLAKEIELEVSSNAGDSIYERASKVLKDLDERERVRLTPSELIFSKDNRKIVLIGHKKNAGVGGAIATGYKWCKDHGIDCTVVMNGDGQMDPAELESICSPIIYEDIDYVKGNRLIHRSAWLVIPKVRFFGNSILSILTKIASGYWHVSDTQSGYTAISNNALNSIRLDKIYKDYGVPNDIMVKLNIAFCTLREVEIKPVYGIGEKSSMKIWKVIPKISWLLFRSFFQRLWIKYLFRDFHPLFLLYNAAFLLFIGSVMYFIKIVKIWINNGSVNELTVLAFFFLFTTSSQFFLFAMWMDMQDNERLYK